MDDTFRGQIPFPAEGDLSLPRMQDLVLDPETVAMLVRALELPGRFLTLLSVAGEILFDSHCPAGVLWKSVWPDGSQPLIDGAVAQARSGDAVMFEVMAPETDLAGPLRWWRVHLTPVLTADGNTVQFLKAQSLDITGKMDQLHRHARTEWLPHASRPGPDAV